MSKSRRIILIVVLLLFAGAMVYVYLRPTKTVETEEAEKLPAEFTFKDNLAVKYGEVVPLQFEILEKDVAKVELIYNDSVFKTWSHPSGKIVYNLQADFYGVGAKSISLSATRSDGTESADVRLVRVLSDVSPEQLTATVVKSYPHNATNFTQGLEFNDGKLYESTGQKGSSRIVQLNLETAAIQKEIGLDGNYFGEGITIFGDKIYQITWQEQKCFVYDKNTFQLLKDIAYTGEGWGLCNDGKYLIMSDGTERITFRDPETFQTERTIEVYDQVGPRVRLNELEYIDGKIYANVWMLDLVLVIDPSSGKVLAEIDGSAVSAAGKGNGEVMNGIAFNPATKKLYFTGKNWSKLLEVRVE